MSLAREVKKVIGKQITNSRLCIATELNEIISDSITVISLSRGSPGRRSPRVWRARGNMRGPRGR